MKVVLHKILVRPRFKKTRNYYLGFGYLEAYLKEQAPEVEVVIVPEADQILQEKPDLVGLSSVTEMWPATVELARSLRPNFDGVILAGGSHISALPRTLPREINVGVIGEGEKTLLEIARRVQAGRTLDDPPLPGAAIWDRDGKLVLGPPAPLLTMDELPLPVQTGQDIHGLSTVRGCPFRCSHCVEWILHKKVRQLSAEALVRGLLHYHEAGGTTKFELLDDLFIAFPKRLIAFHDLMKQRGLLGKFEFYRISLCAHLLTEETVRLLGALGVQDAGIGIESAHPRILQKFKKGVVKVEHLENAIRLAHRYGLPLGGSAVVGYPGETEEELLTTIRFIRRAKKKYGFNFWTYYVCQPLPPSELWEEGLAKGELSADMDFSALRIDADIEHFSSPWYYGNDRTLPRERFKQLVGFRDHGESPSRLEQRVQALWRAWRTR